MRVVTVKKRTFKTDCWPSMHGPAEYLTYCFRFYGCLQQSDTTLCWEVFSSRWQRYLRELTLLVANWAWSPETKWANVPRYQLILARERKEESRPVACANYQHLDGRNRGRNKGSGGGVMAEECARYCRPGRLQDQSILGMILQPSTLFK